jgi:hypothetical protein
MRSWLFRGLEISSQLSMKTPLKRRKIAPILAALAHGHFDERMRRKGGAISLPIMPSSSRAFSMVLAISADCAGRVILGRRMPSMAPGAVPMPQERANGSIEPTVTPCARLRTWKEKLAKPSLGVRSFHKS